MKILSLILFLLPVFCFAQRPPDGSFNYSHVKQSSFDHNKMEFVKVSEFDKADVDITFNSTNITISDVRGRDFKIIGLRNKSDGTSYIYDYLLRDQLGKIYKLTATVPKAYPKDSPNVSFYFMPTKDGYFEKATSYSNN
ncbi:hypothetical protein [Mucilaginibacter arboris]|uniref:Uncharacterized protein n=1 Tax=Mucilaginibacter arboris TaxID=2682090 RepID=A0A7K1SXF8_9SPHI|nr:hypothetical protein [Mucilaginibacter arboris]MVN22002.1 hypothetical protein [Mucilaginibacter arboris]